MKFTYKARTKAGKMESGSIEANSKEAAIVLLQKYDVFTTFLEEEGIKKSFWKQLSFERKVSKKELAVFFRQLSVMLQSRVPVVQSLASLAAENPKQSFRLMLSDISAMVQEGTPLSEALAKYPNVFDSFYVNLARSGEISGNISGALSYIAEHVEREDDIASQIKQAMIYPVFVVCILSVVMAIIVIVVMPRVVDLLKESGTEPSFFTSLVLRFYEVLGSYWWAFGAGLFFIITGLAYYFSTKEGKENFSRIALKIPFISGVLKKIFLTRFCSNISTLLSAGISINKALETTANTINNVVYKKIIGEIEQEVSSGEKISSALSHYPEYFPSFVVQMIKVGEETGKLDSTLGQVVTFYQKEVKRSIDVLSSFIEPLMIIFLGVVVAFLAMSVLSPLYGALGSL